MNTIKKLAFALLVVIVVATGCDKRFNDINTSPNSTTSVPTPYVMTYAQRELGYYLFDVWRSGRQSNVACQHWCQRNYTSEDRYLFRQEVTDGFFRNTYFITQNFQDIINLNTNASSKGEMSAYGDNAVQIATAKLMQIWTIQLLAETFGDVPYTDAWKATTIVMPKYDKQSELFPKLLADATAAVTALKSASKGWTNGDVMFNGNLDKWIKFGNSLRLRLVIRMSNVKADWQAAAKAIITEGVMTSNADNAMIKFTTAGAPNEAPLYNGFIVSKRNDFTLTKQFVGLLKGIDDTDKGYVNPFNGIEDPRFRIYIGESNYDVGRKMGVPYGMSDAATGAFVSANSAEVISLTRTPYPQIIQSNFWSVFMDYATVCFMKSEAYDWNRQYFEDGLRASLAQWGATNVDNFVNAVLGKFDAADATGKKEIVMTQKYIHLFTQGFEAWAEYRRTLLPKSLVKPGQVTYNGVVFATANDSGNDIIPRLKYDSNEYTLNKENVTAAATSIGGDAYNTKLWWAKK